MSSKSNVTGRLTHIDQRYGRFPEMKLHSNQSVEKYSHL